MSTIADKVNPGPLLSEKSIPSVTATALSPLHLRSLKKINGQLATVDGQPIDVWQLVLPTDPAHLSYWAKRFRQHYCLDSEIDALRSGTGYSRAQYLRELLFPDKSNAPRPSIRAGDFAELLVADYVEYLQGYWVPRGKYAEKASRNESVKGVDILGFKTLSPQKSSPSDELLTFEVKAQFTGAKCAGRLQVAIDESRLDYIRRAMTLNATKRRLMHSGDEAKALMVERFQNPTDHPYVYKSGAAAVVSDAVFDPVSIQLSSGASHPNQKNLELLVIRGSDLMSLAHTIYERAADEA